MAEDEVGLKEFLERRRSDLRLRESELLARVSRLQQEVATVREELRRVDAAVGAVLGEEVDLPGDLRLTIKGAVIRILERISPRGLTAMELLPRLAAEFDMHYPRSSLSPQLSRLKGEGKIKLEGGRWYALTK